MELFEEVSDTAGQVRGAPIMADGQAKDKCDGPSSRDGSMPNEPQRLVQRHTHERRETSRGVVHKSPEPVE